MDTLLMMLRAAKLARERKAVVALPPGRRTPPQLTSGESLLVGRRADNGEDYRVPLSSLVGVSRWSQGASGGGKSAQGLAEELQLIRPDGAWNLIKVDVKNESAPWMSDIFLPATLATWPDKDVATFFENYRAVSPFDRDNVLAMNPLVPVAGVPRALQAREVAVLISESLGDSSFGPRMTTILLFALQLALEVGGLSLLEVRALLTNRHYLDGLLAFAKDGDVRDYFMWRFPKESGESIQAVVARLDLLLLSPDMLRSLAATSCIDFAAWVERGVTIVDTGNAPRGAEYASGFWMGIIVRGIARAILGRVVHDETRPTVASLDEWWVALDSDLSGHFTRLVALARAKKSSLWLTNQLSAQVRTRFPELAATLSNSCGSLSYFRQSREDAAALAPAIPLTGRLGAKAGGPTWDVRPMTAEEERRALVTELEHLPERTFYFQFKKGGQRAVKLVAPTVRFAEARAAAEAAPKDIRDACRGGSGGRAEAALDEVVARRRSHMALVAAGHASSAGPDWSDRMPELVQPSADVEPAPAPVVVEALATEVPAPAREPPRRAKARRTRPPQETRPTTAPDGGDDLPFLG